MDQKEPDILREDFIKKGYLTDDYRIFYLEEKESKEYENHYHDFDKVLYFIRGSVRYTIEGKTYDLLPGDIVLVPHGDVHKVEISEEVPYERIVMYLSPQYLAQNRREQAALNSCFVRAKEEYSNVVRLTNTQSELEQIAQRLQKSFLREQPDELEGLYQETLLLQFLIFLNRGVSKGKVLYVDTQKCNIKIVEIIRYINSHLTEKISVELLAQQFFLSKFYMMRQFKKETGYTIGNYMNHKRLLYARELLKKGEPVTQVCFDCGFQEYSTFTRAYKRLFGITPVKSRGKSS